MAASVVPSTEGLCRDCLAHVPVDTKVCPRCRSRRTLFHPELFSLSIAHMDCDAFFAAVEKRDNPHLRDKPVIVGGGRRGVVATACYIARMSGVRSAMPMFKALKACPGAVVVKPDTARYKEAALAIRERMTRLTPLVEPLSVDEAFLDLGGTERLHGAPPADLLARLALEIERDVGITISVGLAPNKFLAKLASDLDKPRGFAVIGAAEAVPFLKDRPVTAIFGVGPAFARSLEREGIRKIGDIQVREEDDMMRRFGTSGRRLWRLSHALDDRPVNPERAVKSVSSETTFGADVSDPGELLAILWRQCEKVSARMKEKGLAGRTVTLKLKTHDFKTRTRRATLDTPTQMAHILYDQGADLLRRETGATRFRLLGIGFSDLSDADLADHPDLWQGPRTRRTQAERAMDSLRAKFGPGAVGTGRSLRSS